MPVANPNLSFLFHSVWMISWSTSPSLVDFGITSEVGPYSSSMFLQAAETRVEVRKKTSLMRKQGGMDFPPRLSLLCCYERAGSRPTEAWRVGRQEEATSFSCCLIPCPLTKLNGLPCAKDHKAWRQALQLPTPLDGKRKGREGQRDSNEKVRLLKHMKQRQIRCSSLVMSQQCHSFLLALIIVYKMRLCF